MTLHKVPAIGLEQYAEHHAEAQRSLYVGRHLSEQAGVSAISGHNSRSRHFNEAASAHYDMAKHHKKKATELVKSSPVSSYHGVQSKNKKQEETHLSMKANRRNN